MSAFAKDQRPDLAGLFEHTDLVNPAEMLRQLDVQDDLEEEQQTIPGSDGDDDDTMQLLELLNTIGEVSKGVSEATDADYRRCALPHMQLKKMSAYLDNTQADGELQGLSDQAEPSQEEG
jgi:hypothetical protein